MGHRHRPKYLKHNNGIYINLGDWIKNFTYGIYQNGEFKLIRFYDIKEKRILNKELIG